MRTAEASTREPAAVWTSERGVPERLVWRGHRFRATRAIAQPADGTWRIDAASAEGTEIHLVLESETADRWWATELAA